MAKNENAANDVEISAYDVVHAPILRHFPELVAELGGSLDDIVDEAGKKLLRPIERNHAVTYGEIICLLDVAANRLTCPDFGMRLAAKQNGAAVFGPLGQAMRNSRKFGEALTYVSEHSFAHSLAARVWLRRVPDEGCVFAGHDILLDNAVNREQAIELILLAGHLSAMELTGGRARARAIHFRHEPVSSLRTYSRYFGCEVRFGETTDGVTYWDSDLAASIVAPDEQAFREIATYIENRFVRRQPPFHAQVRNIILRQLATGACSNEQVASTLCIHLRTLHRRLRDEDTSFQQLKDEVRRDLLRYYLERTDLNLTVVSEKLGFAEQSVMSRNCRRWFAMTPSALRSQMTSKNVIKKTGA